MTEPSATAPSAPAWTRSASFGVALLSGSLMASEIVLTRIFSVVIWYHFAFFVISVALFGLAAGALSVHLFERRLRSRSATALLAASSLSLSVSLVGVGLILTRGTPGWVGIPGIPSHVLGAALLVLFMLSAAPFFAGGFALALAISRWAREAHRLYAWDLAGAGAAAALVVPLLSWLDGPRALLANAGLACLAALAFAGAEPKTKPLRRVALAMLLGLSALGVLAPRTGIFEISVAKGLRLSELREYERWNSFSMVTVLPQASFSGWAPSPLYQGPIAEQKTLIIDLNAMTPLTRFNGRFEDVPHVLADLTAFVYHVRPRVERVCVVGAGGGKDVLAALASGARDVTAIEINPLIVNDLMRGRYREFVGGLYDRSDVHAIVSDGRSFLRASSEKWDVVQLSMVDTSAATAAGAYALTENGLYTVEAFVDFFERLAPNGVFSVSSVSLPGLAVGARLASVTRAALGRMGRDASRSVAVLASAWVIPGVTLHDVLVAPDGFRNEDLARISAEAARQGFKLEYLPGAPPLVADQEQYYIADLLTADGARLNQEIKSWPLDLTPASDDRPFFFYQNRLRDFGAALRAGSPLHLYGNGLFVVSKVAVVALGMVGLFLFVPLLIRRKELVSGQGRVGLDVGYVCCLGLGFMLIEVPLVQRFALYLGNPTATLSVVLFVLLMAGGLGSRWLARGAGASAARRVRWALGGAATYVLGLVFLGNWLLVQTGGGSLGFRSFVCALLLLPLGLLLGAPFPLAIRGVAVRAPLRVPWLFCLNSATSVLGSVAATLIALHFGISAALVSGGILYLVALLLSLAVLGHAETTLSAEQA